MATRFIFILMTVLLISGCVRDPLTGDSTTDLIHSLIVGENDDVESQVAWDSIIDDLIDSNSSIEPQLMEALAGHDSWAVRLGALRALSSLGTKRSVDTVIAALLDDHDLVSLRALTWLRVVTDHREVPEDGDPTGANGLPPIPQSLDLNIWHAWRAIHADSLHYAWSDWWKTHKSSTVIE